MRDQQVFTQVINLTRSVERLRHTQEVLGKAGIAFSRVDAVDGRCLDPQQLKAYSDAAARRYFGRSLTPGEIGCYLSQRLALGHFIASEHAFGLILEDDIALVPEFKDIVDDLIGRHAEWDGAVNMGKDHGGFIATQTRLSGELARYSLCRTPKFPTVATAILWSRTEAQAFLAAEDKIFAPVDHAFQLWFTKRGTGSAVSPPPACLTNLDSDIGVDERNASRRSAAGRIAYQWAKLRRDRMLDRHAKRTIKGLI